MIIITENKDNIYIYKSKIYSKSISLIIENE